MVSSPIWCSPVSLFIGVTDLFLEVRKRPDYQGLASWYSGLEDKYDTLAPRTRGGGFAGSKPVHYPFILRFSAAAARIISSSVR